MLVRYGLAFYLLTNSIKSAEHDGDEHRCEAKRHTCGRPCALPDCRGMCDEDWCAFYDRRFFHAMTLPIACSLMSNIVANRLTVALSTVSSSATNHVGSVTTFMVFRTKRYISAGLSSILKGISLKLYRDEHECQFDCEMPGICEIKPQAHSIEEATYVGQLETFQYTLVRHYLQVL